MFPATPMDVPETPHRILVVDDDVDFARGLQNLLTIEGYEVEVVHNSEEAKPAYKAFRPHVTLMDLRLGQESGNSVVAELYEFDPDLLCVIMTAYASVDSLMEALHTGAYDYLRKPFHADYLFSTLSRCLERRELAHAKAAAEAAALQRNTELEQINERLRDSVRGMQLLTSCKTLGELCSRVLLEIAASVSALGGAIYLAEGDALVLNKNIGPADAAGTIALPPPEGSVFDRVFSSQEAVLVPHAEEAHGLIPRGGDGVESSDLLAFPLLAGGGEPLGVILLQSKPDTGFTPQDRELGQVLVSFCSETLRVVQALEDLEVSRGRFRDFAESASDWFWEADRNLRFTWVSRQTVGASDRQSHMVIGEFPWEYAEGDPKTDENWQRFLEICKAREAFRDFRCRYRDRKGRLRHLSVSGVPIWASGGRFVGYRGTTTDLTSRIEANEARRIIEARFRGMIENSPAAIYLKDLQGRYLLANKRVEEWYGVTVEEIYQKTCYDFFPKDRADAYAWMDRQVVNSAATVEREERVVLADGKEHDIVITKFPVLGSEGRPLGVGAINTDITDRKHAEEQLLQAQKMETLGQLTGGVAHDFNNLLAVILGNLDLVSEGLREGTDLKEMVDSARHAALRGADLTHRLLAYGRRQTLHPRIADLGELISGMTNLLQRTLGERVKIETALSEALWPVMVDTSQMENALLNLAINARDAMSGSGTLRICAGNVTLDQDGQRHLDDTKPGDYVLLKVRDEGCGMEPHVVEHACEPFFTTKEAGKGSGLGLSMVYGFVMQSGGQLRIDSVPGQGTTIVISLPKARDLPDRVAGTPKEVSSAQGEGQRVLVVEDEDEVRKLAATYLTRQGYRVLEAADGESAMDLIQNTPDICLLFTDVVLPGEIGGTELASKATDFIPGLKVLFTSGYAEHVASGQGLLEMELPVLNKPFRRKELLRRVQEVLRELE